MDVGGEEKTLRLSVILYAVVMVLKLGAWWWTGVMALLAEGLHTLSDVFVSAFLLIALRWSRRRPDETHPFGYGRSQYVGALVAAVLFVSFTAFELYREGITRLVGHEGPHESKDVPVALAVLGVSMLIGLWPLVSLLRQKTRGAAARAQLLELVNDQLGLVAALVGTLLVQAGTAIADPLASLVVATIILVNGISLFRENLSYLLGRSLPADELQQLDAKIRAVSGVRGLHRLRAELLAPGSFRAEMHVEVERGLPIERANEIAEAVTTVVAAFTAGPNFVSVHLDPERPAEIHPTTASA
ncbi:MAG: cation diffusion facilitator family transporter [Myxococcota bacterium]